MAKFGIFNENGVPQAFFDDEVNPNIPENAINLTIEQWQELIENQGVKCFKDGTVQDIVKSLEELKEQEQEQERREALRDIASPEVIEAIIDALPPEIQNKLPQEIKNKRDRLKKVKAK